MVVATFYSGMPPEQIETDITGRFERFFTLGAGIDHMESRSLPGVSIIKVFFQPGTNADSDVNEISNLAMADLRRLPPGTLPPIVQKFDASSLPVCLITLQGRGAQRDAAARPRVSSPIRNQLAGVPGASVPQPFGGKYRQIMVYVDPAKLQAYQMSPMDVVRAVNNANLILPAGDVKIGPYDYTLFTNSQFRTVADINRIPAQDGRPLDGAGVATSAVPRTPTRSRTTSSRSTASPRSYLPVMKQGGDTNTIAVVDGIKAVIDRLVDVPPQLNGRRRVRSVAVREARDRDAARRGRHRPGPDRADGAGLPRQPARDVRRSSSRFRCRRSRRSSRSTSAAARSTR